MSAIEAPSAAPKDGRVLVHLGCGERYIPGFVHVDIRPLPHVDIVAPIDRLEAFQDGSVDLIYNCHVLEHVRRGEELRVLSEWYRVLKVGGVLRTSVPDFEAIVFWYQKTSSLEDLVGLLYGRQNYQYNFHFQAFDFARLQRLLEAVGFKDVRRYDWRETPHRNYVDFSQAYLPHMDKEHGVLMSLNVEATKAEQPV